MAFQALFLACFVTSVLSAIVTVYQQETKEAPAFCHKLECPKYTVVKDFKVCLLLSVLMMFKNLFIIQLVAVGAHFHINTQINI